MNISSSIVMVHHQLSELNSLAEILQQAGFEVITLEDAMPDVDQLTDIKPLLILLDISDGLPYDPYHFCHLLQADQNINGTPVIFVSDSTRMMDKVRAFDAGAVDYIEVPFDLVEAVSRVQTHIKLYYQQQEIQRLRESERRHFQMLNNVREDLLRTTTHDLKNPLSVINSYAQMLSAMDGVMDEPRAAEYVQQIINSADQMQHLIEELLDIARLETGVGLNPKLYHLSDFLADYVGRYQAQAQEKDISLTFHPSDTLYFVEIDEIQFGRVISNLLSNAIKYTLDGGEVNVTLHPGQPTGKPGEWVEIHVQDNGIGIPEYAQANIFDKFYRVKTEAHSRQKGTGLGLATAKVIVEQHRGQIIVESERLKGSTFIVQLPLYGQPTNP